MIYAKNYTEIYTGKYEKILEEMYRKIYSNSNNTDDIIIFHKNRYKKEIFSKLNSVFNTIVYGDVRCIHMVLDKPNLIENIKNEFNQSIKDLKHNALYDFYWFDLFENENINRDNIHFYNFEKIEDVEKLSFYSDNKITTTLQKDWNN